MFMNTYMPVSTYLPVPGQIERIFDRLIRLVSSIEGASCMQAIAFLIGRFMRVKYVSVGEMCTY